MPVFKQDDWEGRDQYLELEKAWQAHGGDLAKWRRYLDEQRREGQQTPAEQAA